MRKVLLLILGLSLFLVSIVYGSYTPPSYNNVTLVLEGGYTPPAFNNITLRLGEELNCSPSVDEDWIIEDNQVCDNKEIDIGTGSIIINTNGTLTLINSSNVTAKSLQINTTGDAVYIYSGCELRLG